MSHPAVIVIYVPGDGQMHMVGCHRDNVVGWKYSKWSLLPESELDGFTGEMMRVFGMFHLDMRHLANIKTPGMRNATPVILITPGVTAAEASEAFSRLHMAILKSDDK